MDPDTALLELGRALRAQRYHFTTVTPATHARVVARKSHARDVRDVFGWSLPFDASVLPPDIFAHARAAGVLSADGSGWRSAVRFATDGELLLVHSAYPTVSDDAVFFGPDTHRFLRLLAAEVTPGDVVAELGCGTGAAGIWLARHGAARVVLGDVNPNALRLARVNTRLNGVPDVTVVASDMFAALPRGLDLAVMNPPYVVDAAQRTYRDGGGARGLALAERFLREGLAHVRPGGRLVLYTGTPIVDGVDLLRAGLVDLLAGSSVRYEELDPDVFGEELELAAYHDVERIAVVAVIVDR